MGFISLNVILLNMFYIISVNPQPFDFEKYYSSCEYKVLPSLQFIFPRQIWRIYTSENNLIEFQFCDNSDQKRKRFASIKNEKGQIIFHAENITIHENTATLDSNLNQKCSLSIEFDCYDTIPTQPFIISSNTNNCSYVIKMRRPNCEPKCTYLLDNKYLIDLRSLNHSFVIKDETGMYAINLCGYLSDNNCKSSEISACFIEKGTLTALSYVQSQTVYYDRNKNQLLAKGQFRNPKKKTNKYEVEIVCDWETNTISNLTHIIFQTQSARHHQFRLYSSLACIKLPQNCQARSYNNLNYDLSGIYTKQMNDYQVGNVSAGRAIYLNICGPVKNSKSPKKSQVYELHKETSRNLGAILMPLKVDGDLITAKFISGDKCEENSTYSTKIDFFCHENDLGPILKGKTSCILNIEWKTPHACPIDRYVGNDCKVTDRMGNRNLASVYRKTDYFMKISKEMFIFYNFCGSVHLCDGFNNASICLHRNIGDKKTERVLGWKNYELISENGELRQEFKGNGENSNINVHFVCSYQNLSEPLLFTKCINGCLYNFTFFTNLACLSPEINSYQHCTVKHGYDLYDLSALIRKDNNYEIKSGNLSFILNICSPVLNKKGVLCKKNTMICVRNNMEYNIKHRFQSIGGFEKLIFSNNGLILYTSTGEMCQNFNYYKSMINFNCSDKEDGPNFIMEQNCVYNFYWNTPNACPKLNTCVLKSPEKSLDLNVLNNKLLKIKFNNMDSFEFNLCKDSYVKIVNETRAEHFLQRSLSYLNSTPIITLVLNQTWTENDQINKVVFKISCTLLENNINYRKLDFENGTLKMSLETYIVCSEEEKEGGITAINNNNNIEQNKVTDEKPNNNNDNRIIVAQKVTEKAEEIQKKKCLEHNFIINNQRFNLSTIASDTIIFEKNRYIINFNNENTDCDGLLCKNGRVFVELSSECPILYYFSDNSSIKFEYLTNIDCLMRKNGFYGVEITISCSEDTTGIINKIYDHNECFIKIEQYNPSVCFLFVQKSHTNIVLIIAVLTTVISLAFCFVLVVVLRRKGYCQRFDYSTLDRSNKSNIQLYSKDSSL